MKTIKIEYTNTNNAWGFGGAIFLRTHYDNGLLHDKGRACFRHLSPEWLDRWLVGTEDGFLTLKGFKPNKGLWVVVFSLQDEQGSVYYHAEVIDPKKTEITELVADLPRHKTIEDTKIIKT
jgi:hypothetical protein